MPLPGVGGGTVGGAGGQVPAHWGVERGRGVDREGVKGKRGHTHWGRRWRGGTGDWLHHRGVDGRGHRLKRLLKVRGMGRLGPGVGGPVGGPGVEEGGQGEELEAHGVVVGAPGPAGRRQALHHLAAAVVQLLRKRLRRGRGGEGKKVKLEILSGRLARPGATTVHAVEG